jgi:Tol biopolymer transport system component
MNRDGFKLQRITDDRFASSDERTPVWSPDGVWIAFTSNLNGTRQLFIVRNNGSKLQKPLTDNPAVWFPDWRP